MSKTHLSKGGVSDGDGFSPPPCAGTTDETVEGTVWGGGGGGGGGGGKEIVDSGGCCVTVPVPKRFGTWEMALCCGCANDIAPCVTVPELNGKLRVVGRLKRDGAPP